MANRIFLCGDIHGDASPIFDLANRVKLDEDDYIIFLGDFCANYYLSPRDDKFKQQLEEIPGYKIALRGNHEARPTDLMHTSNAFDKWSMIYARDLEVQGNFIVQHRYPHILYMMDEPSLYTIRGKSILTLPGAYSIDKYYRLQNGWSWFENEQMTQEEMDKVRAWMNEPIHIDAIFSHTCPLKYEPKDLFLPFINQSSVDKTMESFFDEVDNKLHPNVWVWGHFHQYREYPREEDGRRALMLFNDKLVLFDELFDKEKDSLTTY